MSNELTTLEHEIEETREHLASTIDQLLHRVHPKTIVSREAAAIKGYFVDARTGGPRTDNILKVVGGVVGAVALFVAVRKVAG
ncbi:DUF3618 domain-containing protein [Nocardioides coralli]|uniref:DUF3618 domain-containing protein n=1 Tax=Nocardioides coralli TaxID=2872154 RepID=UPI001CA3FD8A|nr:DUF3618 domain-containing protein [Nocardioides coralli]QZY28357.1 DUF3618 domain-containing protein [Nocardioides coralli]